MSSKDRVTHFAVVGVVAGFLVILAIAGSMAMRFSLEMLAGLEGTAAIPSALMFVAGLAMASVAGVSSVIIPVSAFRSRSDQGVRP